MKLITMREKNNDKKFFDPLDPRYVYEKFDRMSVPREIPKYSEGAEKRPLHKKQILSYEPLDSLDESPEFLDPYSELNLFLSQKIKKEMNHCSNSKKWSIKLQDELLHKISPDFRKQFPKYRLGIYALKKTWEKVQFFSTELQGQKEAFSQDGKLNLPFFIKENLKTSSKLPYACHVHPYHFAHQQAVKMSECIAVVDGIRPKLDQLTRTIWSLQRHLIPNLAPNHFKSPYDENERSDKLIVKLILEIGSKHLEISQAELGYHVEKRIKELKILSEGYSENQIKKMLTAIFADQTDFTTQKMEKTLEAIPYPIAKCLKRELANIAIDSPHLEGERVVQEALGFFQKAGAAIAGLEEEEIERKIQNWTIQSDMLIRWIRMNHGSMLYKEVEQAWNKNEEVTLQSFVAKVRRSYLEKNANLLPFAREVERRIWIFVKYIWYKKAFSEDAPTYDRFLKWHKHYLYPMQLAPQELVEKIEKLCKKMLPLMPFHRARTHALMLTEKEK